MTVHEPKDKWVAASFMSSVCMVTSSHFDNAPSDTVSSFCDTLGYFSAPNGNVTAMLAFGLEVCYEFP